MVGCIIVNCFLRPKRSNSFMLMLCMRHFILIKCYWISKHFRLKPRTQRMLVKNVKIEGINCCFYTKEAFELSVFEVLFTGIVFFLWTRPKCLKTYWVRDMIYLCIYDKIVYILFDLFIYLCSRGSIIEKENMLNWKQTYINYKAWYIFPCVVRSYFESHFRQVR